MFKSSGKFGAETNLLAGLALENAAQDLVARKSAEAAAAQSSARQARYEPVGVRSGKNELHKDDSDDEQRLSDDDSDDEYERLKRERLAELHREQRKIRENVQRGHGDYREVTEEEFLPEVTGSELVVCHFYHKDFERCKIVDKHLKDISAKHLSTKFIRINVEKCPFFVQKLSIKVLPTLVLFHDGVAKDRIVGFTDFENSDDFPTARLELRLAIGGCCDPALIDEELARAPVQQPTNVFRSSSDALSDDDDF